MKGNFIVTILLFFVAMLASGIFAELIKHKLTKRTSRFIGVISFLIGAIFVMPTYKGTGIRQILFFTALIFFINFALMMFFPESKAASKK